jgi:hypothetical protein
MLCIIVRGFSWDARMGRECPGMELEHDAHADGGFDVLETVGLDAG